MRFAAFPTDHLVPQFTNKKHESRVSAVICDEHFVKHWSKRNYSVILQAGNIIMAGEAFSARKTYFSNKWTKMNYEMGAQI